MNFYICPACKGLGKPSELYWRGRWQMEQNHLDTRCLLCRGWGRVTREQIQKRVSGEAQQRYLRDCDEQDQHFQQAGKK